MRFDCCGSCSRFDLELDRSTLELERVRSVWWRRPHPPRVSDDIGVPSHRQFAANEAEHALGGLWQCLDAEWINDPLRDQAASRKSFQLRVAQAVGLPIPVTLISNDPHQARRFVDERGYRNVVYKAFSATEQEWRETRLLRTEELALLDHVRHAPVIFQEYVEAVYDLRVTVIGEELFAAAIHSQQTDYKVDCRIDIGRARIEAVELPADVAALLRRLVARLGLVFGAVDMRLTPDGRHVFLEINPAGQFLYIEAATGQPMAAAMARALLERAHVGAS
jgi:glutathione synthase/RimK-type ligase-like ATP-grasp enzyme